jgi:hypothetical protein
MPKIGTNYIRTTSAESGPEIHRVERAHRFGGQVVDNPFDGGAGKTDTNGQVCPCCSWALMVATLSGV